MIWNPFNGERSKPVDSGVATDRLAPSLQTGREELYRCIGDELSRKDHLGHQDSALIAIDIVAFSTVAIRYGMPFSDWVSAEVEERLGTLCRSGDYLARIGLDQFAILLTGILSHEHVLLATHKLETLLAEPFSSEGRRVRLRTRVGIAFLSDFEAQEPEEVHRGSLTALHRAKSTGESFAVYHMADREQYDQMATLEADLPVAIESNDLSILFQPKQELQTDRIYGSEALLRWQHHALGFVPPRVIVDLANRLGLAERLTHWLINQVLRHCSSWNRQGRALSVSLNIETDIFDTPDLPEYLESALELWNVEPGHLTLEVTEATLMKDTDEALRVVRDLHEVGVRVSIDDFGTGYSSLAYLNRLDADELKIDKSFIDALDDSRHDRSMVEMIVMLGHGMGVEVVAEGIQAQSQLQALRAMSCDFGQGFLISYPLTSENFAAFVETTGRDGV